MSPPPRRILVASELSPRLHAFRPPLIPRLLISFRQGTAFYPERAEGQPCQKDEQIQGFHPPSACVLFAVRVSTKRRPAFRSAGLPRRPGGRPAGVFASAFRLCHCLCSCLCFRSCSGGLQAGHSLISHSGGSPRIHAGEERFSAPENSLKLFPRFSAGPFPPPFSSVPPCLSG